MKRRYTKSSRVIIYCSMVFLAVAAFLLLAFVYTIKSGITLDPSDSTGSEITTYSNGEVFTTMSNERFNFYVKDFIDKNALLPKGIKIVEAYYVFKEMSGEETDKLYLNLVNENFLPNVMLSFVTIPSVNLGNGSISASISDIKFGKLEVSMLGGFFWNRMKLPESFNIVTDGLLQAKALKAEGNGNVVLNHAYDKDKLSADISAILAFSEERKIALHRNNGGIDEWLINLCEAKTASYESSIELIKRFEQDPETFFNLCMLLNQDGISMLCGEFGEGYYKYIPKDRLTQLSDEEIYRDLNEYHRNFSKNLLQYLYDNPSYYISNGELYSQSKKITAEDVASARGGVSGVYTVAIRADNNTLSAIYTLSGYETERTIFNNIGY